MNQRQLLTLAIIAFDVMVKDCIEQDAKGEPFHEIPRGIFQFLVDMLNIQPEFSHDRQQYLLNVTEIASNIKRMFVGSPVSEEDLKEMLVLQADRLRWLGTDRASEEALHVRSTDKVH